MAGVISGWLTIYLQIPDPNPTLVSERVESSNSEDDSASEADSGSDDEIYTGGLDDVNAAAAHQTNPNLSVFDQVHGPQGS